MTMEALRSTKRRNFSNSELSEPGWDKRAMTLQSLDQLTLIGMRQGGFNFTYNFWIGFCQLNF